MNRIAKTETLKYREEPAVAECVRRIAAGRGLSFSDFVRYAVRKEAGLVATNGPQVGHDGATERVAAGPFSPIPPIPLAQEPSALSPGSTGATAFRGKHLRISAEQHALFQDAFTGRDLAAEYRRMDSWLAANPGRRKRNHHRFAQAWLSKPVPAESRQAGNAPPAPAIPGQTDYAAIANSRKRVIE